MNGILLYQSKYGATKQYADWIAAKTGFPCMPTKQAKLQDVLPYDTLLLAGGVYASGIAGLGFLKKHLERLADKRIGVLCVAASPYTEAAFQALYAHNFRGSLQGIRCFYARGAWNPEAMSWTDRKLCGMLQKSVAKKDPATYAPWEQALMEAAKSGACDWTDQQYLAPLYRWLENKEKAIENE